VRSLGAEFLGYRLAIAADYLLSGLDLKIVRNGYVVFDGAFIAEVGSGPPRLVDEVREYRGCLVMPGLVNCHVSTLCAAFKDESAPIELDTRFSAYERILELREKLLSLASRSQLLEAARKLIKFMVKSGTTTMLDFVRGGAEKVNLVLEALEKVNVNALLLACPEHKFYRDEVIIGHSEYPPEVIQPILKMSRKLKGFGLMNPLFIPANALRQLARVAEGRGFFKAIHAGEMPPAEWEGKGVWKTQVEMALGFFKADMLFHVNYISEEDVKLIAESGKSVVCCTRLTQALRFKPAPIDLMVKHGVNVTLGTGNSMIISPDMLREVEATYNFYSYLGKPIKPVEVLKMATVNAGEALKERVGAIEEGYRADVVVLRVDEGNMYATRDIIASVVKRAGEMNIEAVYVGGKEAP